jgi:hypothetical protein
MAQFLFHLLESVTMSKPNIVRLLLLSASTILLLSGCGTVIGLATDTVIAVAKVPFKVAGAVVDVATGDADDKESKKKSEPSK